MWIRKARLLLTLSLVLLGIACGKGSGDPPGNGANQYDFGKVAVGTTATRVVTTITNPQTTAQSVTVLAAGSTEFAPNSDMSCGQSLPANGTCNVVVGFTPAGNSTMSSSLTVTLGSESRTIPLSGTGVTVTPGNPLLTQTPNPLVAAYTVFAQAGSSVSIEFGPDTNYGRMTSAKTAPVNGGPVLIYVAGMRASTAYHMRARITDMSGTLSTDADQTFTTGAWTQTPVPNVTTTTSSGMTPQPGLELVDATSGTDPDYLQAFATDLDGNLVWAYDYPDRQKDSIVQPIKLLPNGNFLLIISFPSQAGAGQSGPGELVVLREIDLAGNPVRQISLEQLNRRLQANGFNLKLDDFHHDFALLPNGHVILLASTSKSFNNLPGQSGTTNVLGDVLIDLDPQFQPVWVWNQFDHLDVNRQPMGFPDWTHSNAVVYTGDGNLLVSIRHQNWIVKVDYANGAGSGNVLWRLGPGGDFQLINGTDPQDWFYAQHAPSFVGPNTAGTFSLIMMDNGDDRVLSNGDQCNGLSGPACYTTIPVLAIDEGAKTATLNFHLVIPNEKYSLWGGNANQLANGNYEFDLCAQPNTSSEVNEVLPNPTANQVWRMTSTGLNFYRASRISSLYPGVQW